jgi:hypothetical protein
MMNDVLGAQRDDDMRSSREADGKHERDDDSARPEAPVDRVRAQPGRGMITAIGPDRSMADIGPGTT